MALSKSVATVIQENEYWLRLGTFLHDPLKNAFLSVLHNSINDLTYVGLPDEPILLYQELSKHRNLIAQLVKKKILQEEQVDLLLPPNDNKTYSSKFDVTLIAILIRNFTTLKPPLNGWNDKNAPIHDKSKGAGVVRGREWRNYVHHTEPKDVDQAEFNKKWAEGTQIITDLEYQYDTGKLKTISLDPKHDVVLKSLFSFITNLDTKVDSHSQLISSLDTKVDSLRTNHSKLIASLTQQLHKISNEVQHVHQDKERQDYSNTKSSSCCLKNVLDYISKEIKEEEATELLDRLHIHADGDLTDKLKPVPWEKIKSELKMLGRPDIAEYIRKNTLITRGLQNASNELRNHYKIELINCLVEQPLSSIEMDSQYTSREDIYIDLAVLPSSTVDEEWSNSDRDALMKQNLLDKSSTVKAVDKVIEPQDEMIFIRGVAGVGKSSLIDMFTLKWAKNELSNPCMFDFVFKFTCRELNLILTELGNLEQIFQLQYQKIFGNVTFEDLAEVSERVLIIVDGVDELKDIYQMDGLSTSSADPFLKVFFDLLNPKSFKALKNHKTIVSGRPKACEFVKNQFSELKIKTIEVCGFSHINVQRYIMKFFKNDELKAKKVQDIIAYSYNLKVMSTVPVFLWVICNVYSEDLIKNPIATNTELYFYTCLILLRNHFQGSSNNYKNLQDIVQDRVMADVVYALMVLSVKTYMQNQVLFTDKDVKKLNCPVHLEQTGFIVKYSRSNIAIATYQFRHLILQEFLCGLYLCVTKRISPFLSNRELSNCMPTIHGIHRMIQEKEDKMFLHFYKALLASNDRMSNYFTKLFGRFRSRSYDKFMKQYDSLPTLPQSMLKSKTLYITDEPDCREFLNLFKEATYVGDVPFIVDAAIELRIYKNFKNILNLLEKLHVIKIRSVDITSSNLIDDSGNMDEYCLQFCKMTAGSSMRSNIFLHSDEADNRMSCTDERLWLHLFPPLPSSLPDIIKTTTNRFDIYIYDDVIHHAVPGFLQEITTYAIKHCKRITLNFYSGGARSSIISILKDSEIDLKSRYIDFVKL